jgi:hypothetical protein
MDSNRRFRAEIGNAFTGAAPSSGVRRAMRKVAKLAMRRQRGFAQRSHSAAPVSTSRPASERSACVTSRESVVTDLGLSSKLTSEVPLLCPGNDPDGEAASGAPRGSFRSFAAVHVSRAGSGEKKCLLKKSASLTWPPIEHIDVVVSKRA